MSLLNIVNKFCAFNNFLPWQLYGSNKEVIVRYNSDESSEFYNFLSKVAILSSRGLVSTTIHPSENKIVIIKGCK